MKKNILFAAAILALAAVFWIWTTAHQTKGQTALVSIVDAQSITLPLDTDKVYVIDESEGAKCKVTLEVKDGKIRFIDSVCRDHICENEGWLAHENEQAICLPAGVVVSVEAK
ncbi:MAG: NusG domain II-containing protein [Ruthenibacterium sp.]